MSHQFDEVPSRYLLLPSWSRGSTGSGSGAGRRESRRVGAGPPLLLPAAGADGDGRPTTGTPIPLELVNLIRERVRGLAAQPATLAGLAAPRELLECWSRDGGERRLFFGQLEAAETIIFLTEARRLPPGHQGPSTTRRRPPARATPPSGRYACKMATGAGKTTVMGMLAAWSILNKLADRADARFSDRCLLSAPTSLSATGSRSWTRRGRSEHLPYARPRPERLMPELRQGRVILNWHVFEPLEPSQVGGECPRAWTSAGREADKATWRGGASWAVRGGKRTSSS